MLSFFLHPVLMQLPMAEAGQLLLVTGIAFAIITLIASTSRFHKMIQLTEEELHSTEDCNDFFFIQVTRYLSKINRASAGFTVLVVQLRTEKTDCRPAQEELLQRMRKIIREDSDKACLFREDCVAAIIDTEEETAADVIDRMTDDLNALVKSLPDIFAFRAGASIFPLHGLNTQQIIDTATEALEQASFENERPIRIAPAPEEEKEEPKEKQEETERPEVIGEISREDKNAALDPLTGVLKPETVGSYMRKYLAEIRRKKDPAAVLCVGINRIDNIIHLHGEEAADSVIAGVSEILQKLTRDSDLIGRYHRDDFLVLAPCSLKQGEMIGLRVRDAVQKNIFLFEGKPIKTSIAVGITAMPEHGRNLRDLFRGAYGALEIVRGWNTSSCLVYDPAQHDGKINHDQSS